MCGHGGIGRRVTLRSLWAKPVEVQVFLAAPIKNLPKVKKETREISQTYSNVPQEPHYRADKKLADKASPLCWADKKTCSDVSKKITSEQIRKKTCQ